VFIIIYNNLKRKTMNRMTVAIYFTLVFMLGGCATTGLKTSSNKQQSILAMKNEVLTDLFKLKPDVRSQIKSASGYAVFSNINVRLFFLGLGGGQGVVKNNKTGKHTYMKMAEAGLGVGLGAKDFRVVFVFHSTDSMSRFVEDGWAFGVQADATAKVSDKGRAFGGAATHDNITIYQLTENGLALQAMVTGTKYWKDDALN
jgi:lipid-binding SYLF domain-containing protein